MNLLIVDDEYYIVQGILRAVKQSVLNFEKIFVAYSIEQGKKILEKESVRILLTDIEMPQEDGLSLIRWIRENSYQVTVLIITGHQRFDYAQKAVMMHCFSYLLKPVDNVELIAQLRKAVESTNGADVCAVRKDMPAFSVEGTDNFIRQVQDYIREHLASPELNRTSLAEHIHMNPEYLSSLFHTKFGQTLSSYITGIRIDKARELLTHTRLPLSVISERCGFSSSSYFHKQFKKATGLTPQQFRMPEEKNDWEESSGATCQKDGK